MPLSSWWWSLHAVYRSPTAALRPDYSAHQQSSTSVRLEYSYRGTLVPYEYKFHMHFGLPYELRVDEERRRLGGVVNLQAPTD
eukprot:scaffold46296_cov37-Prasinocladus_malaysianus.AAC.2